MKLSKEYFIKENLEDMSSCGLKRQAVTYKSERGMITTYTIK